MLSEPKRLEIDHHTIKLIIGVIALSLAGLTSGFAAAPLQSISASYHEGGWSRDIFVGFLFAIGALLLAYNGRSTREMLLSKTAAFAAVGVAMFPCRCGDHPEIIANVHGLAAAIMFVILALFCVIFLRRASRKPYGQARIRVLIYAACGISILGAIIVLAYDNLSGGALGARIDRLTFWGEAVGLVSFGIAWLTASRVLPLLTNRQERISLSPFRNGDS